MPSLTAQYKARNSRNQSLRKKALWLSVLQAFVLGAVILTSAKFVTVLVLNLREEPDFSAPKTIYLPQRQLEHQMAVAEFQNAAATPTTIPALTTENLLASLPALPSLPDIAFTPVENDAMISESDALFGQSGLMGALGALSSQASSVSFLGITEEASRFVVMIDVSGSVVRSAAAAEVDFDTIRIEAVKLLESLNANTLFGIVLHGRQYVTYSEYLIPATIDNKDAAVSWLNQKFSRADDSGVSLSGANLGDNGTNGIVAILDAVFDMQPDAIFMVSDGNYFTWNNRKNTARDHELGRFGRPVEINEVLRLITDHQRELTQQVRIHAIHFQDPRGFDDRIGGKMRNIANRTKGKYRKIGN